MSASELTWYMCVCLLVCFFMKGCWFVLLFVCLSISLAYICVCVCESLFVTSGFIQHNEVIKIPKIPGHLHIENSSPQLSVST